MVATTAPAAATAAPGASPRHDGEDGSGSCFVGPRDVQVGFPGTGGRGGGARTTRGDAGQTGYLGPGGGGGGGGHTRGGGGGTRGAGLCGGAGGGGGGRSSAGTGVRPLAYSGVAGHGDGTITLRRYTGSKRFDCERRSVPWPVPAGVARVYAIAVGGEGGRPTGATTGHAPGHGARVAGDLDVGARRSLDITTGCDGNRGPGYGLGRGGSRGTAELPRTPPTAVGAAAPAPCVRATGRCSSPAAGASPAAVPRRAHPTGRATPAVPAGRPGTGRARRAPGAASGARATSVTVAVAGRVARRPGRDGGDGGTSSTGGGGGGGGGGCLRGGDGGSHGGEFGGGGGGGAGDSCADAALTDARFTPSTDPGDGFVLLVY